MRLHISIIFILVILVECRSGSPGNNFRNGYQLDYREIARQNRITEQILQNYLEKRLFPNNHQPSRAPTVWDILPRARRKPNNNNNNNRKINNNIQDVLNSTIQETLESGESARVSFFDDRNNIDDGSDEDDLFEQGRRFYFVLENSKKNRNFYDENFDFFSPF